MLKIFISYRRDDSAYATRSIYDELAKHYGEESVVFDVHAIPKGVDFVEYLNTQVGECDVLLAVIGDRWFDQPDGKRRIDDLDDFVRIEIEAALQRDIPVIPVLVGNASMPTADQLPEGLRPLSRRSAAEVRPGSDTDAHLERLVRDVDESLKYKKADTKSALITSFWQLMSQRRWWKAVAVVAVMSVIMCALYVYVVEQITVELVWIKPNTFTMGSPAVGETQHEVTLTEGFHLGKYEVTQKEYHQVMGVNPSKFKGDKRRPVEKVSWFNAIDFCNRLSEREGLPPYYDVREEQVTVLGGEGYRLPTEAEWEYACRAGTTTAFHMDKGAKGLEHYAWYALNSGESTHAVGQNQPNAWGLYDMHGNVGEWCWDRYGQYPTTPQENPTGPTSGLFRVIRGGSWLYDARNCRSASRGWFRPEYWDSFLGFRVARSFVKQGNP